MGSGECNNLYLYMMLIITTNKEALSANNPQISNRAKKWGGKNDATGSKVQC